MDRHARVRVAGDTGLRRIPISGHDKPAVDDEYLKKWQQIVDLAARIIDVPSGLIMRLDETEIEVFIRSRSEKNPYSPHERAELGLGLYCETVVGRGRPLIVPDALEDRLWDHNPDLKLNMVSYLGVPIRWGDGEVFGTMCVLDSRARNFSRDEAELIERFAELIEKDLLSLADTQATRNRLEATELRLRELRHRIKNQFNLLAGYIDLRQDSSATESGLKRFAPEIRNRIVALARLHELLLDPGSRSSIDVSAYLTSIAGEIAATATYPIEVASTGESLRLNEDRVVPLGMLMNELVTNSIKYAFADVDAPRIEIDLRTVDDEVVLSYRDNGKSGYGGHTESDAGGLGSLIIEGIADQLEGSAQEEITNGYRFTLRIPASAVADEDQPPEPA